VWRSYRRREKGGECSKSRDFLCGEKGGKVFGAADRKPPCATVFMKSKEMKRKGKEGG